MIIHNLRQGTKEWLAFRVNHYTASDAAAMLGVSRYKSRDQLLYEKYLGVHQDEVDTFTQKNFDDGHRFETLARPLAEKIIGFELYPVTGSLPGTKLAASFDGITVAENLCFEHKKGNKELYACSEEHQLPLHYLIQVQQQLLVSGASSCLFMASDWDDKGELIKEVHFWIKSYPELQQRIINGWRQFEEDIKDYSPKEIKVHLLGSAPEALPALSIEMSGTVTSSNLHEFKQYAMIVFSEIKTDLQSDEDFANAEKTMKWCKEVESKLESAKQHAFSQIGAIEEAFRIIDAVKESARDKRLLLEKLVTQQKKYIKEKLVLEAKEKFSEHLKKIEKRFFSQIDLNILHQPDFASAIKGLKTQTSMQNALNTQLANEKITVNEWADQCEKKLLVFNQDAKGVEFLFPDLSGLVHKPLDDFVLIIQDRIKKHREKKQAPKESHKNKTDERQLINNFINNNNFSSTETNNLDRLRSILLDFWRFLEMCQLIQPL